MRDAVVRTVWLVLGTSACGASTAPLALDGGPLPPEQDAGPPPECPERDADGDGYAATACGGTDCDDGDASVYPGPIRDHVWRSVDIDTSVPPQLAIPLGRDSTGELHVVYVDREGREGPRRLRHARLGAAGGAWQVEWMFPEAEAVDDVEPSLAFDASGGLHLAFVRRPLDANGHLLAPELTVASLREGAWELEVIDRRADAGAWAPAMAVEPGGVVHVTYAFHAEGGPEDDEVRHATNASGTWISETAHRGAGLGTMGSLALDSSGAVHLCDSFRRPGVIDDTVGYATNASGTWLAETVILAPCCSASIWLDSGDRPWILVADSQAGTAILEQLDRDNWNPLTMDLGGFAKDAAIVQASDPRREIFFTAYTRDEAPATLRYAWADGELWSAEPVSEVPGEIAAVSGLRDPDGALHVVYLGWEPASGIGASDSSRLRYARRRGASGSDRSCD